MRPFTAWLAHTLVAACLAGANSRSKLTNALICSGVPIDTRCQVGIDGKRRPTSMPRALKASTRGPISLPVSVITKLVSEGI